VKLKHFVFGLCAAVIFVGATARSAYADICLQDDSIILPRSYQLQIGTGNPGSGTPIIVTGVRVVASLHRHPVFGTLQVFPDGSLVIGLQTVFDFGSGSWTQPVETSLFRFGKTTITYDTTGFGNGAPSNSTGLLHVIGCPLTSAPPAPPGAQTAP
jgi:hypothetical protein